MAWAMFIPGPLEFGVILLVALLLFAKRLPAVGRGLGRGIVELKKGLTDGSEPKEGRSDVTDTGVDRKP